MTLKNLYILISLIIIIIVNYFIYQTITNSHKTKEIKASVMTINNIAKTHNNEAKQIQVEKIVRQEKTIQEKKTQKPINTKPLFSIIIDDVSFSQHLRNLLIMQLSHN